MNSSAGVQNIWNTCMLYGLGGLLLRLSKKFPTIHQAARAKKINVINYCLKCQAIDEI